MSTALGPDYALYDLWKPIAALGAVPQYITTTERRKALASSGTGRNVGLFELTRRWSYRRRGDYDETKRHPTSQSGVEPRTARSDSGGAPGGVDQAGPVCVADVGGEVGAEAGPAPMEPDCASVRQRRCKRTTSSFGGIMHSTKTGLQLIGAIAFVATFAAGTTIIGMSSASALPSVTASEPGWQFEFAATYQATVSCYFENLDRTDATGPFKFTGTGKSESAAVNDAKSKAQAAVPQGKKVKHCRTEKVQKR
ncbi:hypothetical protein [Nocardia sp. NPDC049707]|uniref:hypothetical protein n=1 Tax=Nocardia sp. NPDC049707 TaxID=3154735 RepID=UPI0034343005